MPKIPYIIKRLSKSSRYAIAQANTIIEEYAAQGYDLTLRQVYYKFVARDLFPDDRKWAWNGSKWVHSLGGTKNAEPNYKWLGSLINDGRLCGLIDWDYIVDRTRNLHSLAHWKGAKDRLNSAAKTFRIDKWAKQPCRVEVWIEKEGSFTIYNKQDVKHEFQIMEWDWPRYVFMRRHSEIDLRSRYLDQRISDEISLLRERYT